jgi:hypothetical protein
VETWACVKNDLFLFSFSVVMTREAVTRLTKGYRMDL